MKKLEMRPESLKNINTHTSILKNTKGITLIALVITIIVLIILAGVAINTLTGDNGIITRAIQAKDDTAKEEAKEEVNVVVAALQIEKDITQMTQEEQREYLENELKNIESTSSVETYGKGFIAKHKGYDFEISAKLAITNIKETFNAEEWDKSAAPEDCFYWASNDPNDEGYGTIMGYTKNIKIDNYTILRYPSRCTQIEFNGTSLRGVTYDDGTLVNESRTFTNNILKVELPETVKIIGDSAFGTVDGGAYSFNKMSNIDIPNRVTSIGNLAFAGCTELTSISIPEGVTSIGKYAFYMCTKLTNISIPEGATSIGEYAFYKCTKLTNISIPEGVTSIGKYAFYECIGITSINIPESVTNIEDNVFGGCTGLTNISISEGITSIGDVAFRYCSSLTSIEIPKSVTSIGLYAFDGCTELISVTLPNNVTNIEGSFYGCENLSSVIYRGVTYTSKSDLYNELSKNGVNYTVFSSYKAFDGTALSD